jgi:CheY-like chemotaxis protein
MANVKQSGARFNKVLLIDDNEIDNFINERIITSTNFSTEVIVRNSATLALDVVREFFAKNDSSYYPEIIFLDLNMPVMDGFQFLVEFEKIVNDQNKNLDGKCKIIVLSSSISPADIDKASQNKYVIKYLNKPLSEKYLNAVHL